MSELYVVILNDGSKDYAIAPCEGEGSRSDAEASIDFWNETEGWTASLGIVTPVNKQKTPN